MVVELCMAYGFTFELSRVTVHLAQGLVHLWQSIVFVSHLAHNSNEIHIVQNALADTGPVRCCKHCESIVYYSREKLGGLDLYQDILILATHDSANVRNIRREIMPRWHK